MCCPGNKIGDEGARALSEALKTNATLQSLNLWGEQEESGQDKIGFDEKSRTWLSACESKKKVRKMDGLHSLTTTNTNKQETSFDQKEHEHCARH